MNIEMAARRIGYSLYETGVYENIQAHCNVPAVGVPKLTEDYKKRKSFATALAIGGENYWSKSHIDNDFYFTSLSVLSKQSIDSNKILYYFVFHFSESWSQCHLATFFYLTQQSPTLVPIQVYLIVIFFHLMCQEKQF